MKFLSVLVCAIALGSRALVKANSSGGGFTMDQVMRANQQLEAQVPLSALTKSVNAVVASGSPMSIDREELASQLNSKLSAYPGLAGRIYDALSQMPDSALKAYAAKHSPVIEPAPVEEIPSFASFVETPALVEDEPIKKNIDESAVESSSVSQLKEAVEALTKALGLADLASSNVVHQTESVSIGYTHPIVPTVPVQQIAADSAVAPLPPAPSVARPEVKVEKSSVDVLPISQSTQKTGSTPRLQLRLPAEVSVEDWLAWGLLQGMDYDILPTGNQDDIIFHIGEVDVNVVAPEVLYLATTPTFTALAKLAIDSGFSQTTNCGQVCWEKSSLKRCVSLFDLMKLSLRADSAGVVFPLTSDTAIDASEEDTALVQEPPRMVQDAVMIPQEAVEPYPANQPPVPFNPLWWRN